MVVEIVDAEDKIEAFLATVEPMMTKRLVTLEKVRVRHYGQAED